MNEEKKSLGRGLDSLLGERPERQQQGILQVPLEDLVPGQYQPRNKMHKDTLEELSKSIKAQGVLQPILARKKASKGYEIVVGERRWRAAQLAGLKTIPTIVKELNNDEAAKIALIENLQREDLNAMDQARGLQRLQIEFNLSQQDLASSVGKSRPTITNLIRLTKLSPVAQELLESGRIEMGHARALLTIEESLQKVLAEEIASKQLSVREVERLVARQDGSRKQKQTQRKRDPNTIKLEKEISEALGAKVGISHNKKGAGKLIINFKNLDQLQGILDKIK
ncbi:MAG: ParB/RepB/Spo0J family partition protein [SAR86 cluster bacterium]|jgi:ParB family chromosome partitioning protein|tara:strand:- start:1477 stop:2322 length:846 start_codon:yes stop_codon:yes gene_type:complete